MPWVMVGLSAASGITKIVGAMQGREARIEEQRQANNELARRKVDLEGTDISNPYANMENTMEDLTVNTQQAEFEAQQNQQNQANIMQGMQGAAGGSGVAGLAQAMANQGASQAQRASASIGQQEAANQKLAAKEASKIQSKERYGKSLEQDRQMDLNETMMGLAQRRKIGADDARQKAREQIASGIGDIGAGVNTAFSYKVKGGVSGKSGFKMTGPTFFKTKKKK